MKPPSNSTAARFWVLQQDSVHTRDTLGISMVTPSRLSSEGPLPQEAFLTLGPGSPCSVLQTHPVRLADPLFTALARHCV